MLTVVVKMQGWHSANIEKVEEGAEMLVEGIFRIFSLWFSNFNDEKSNSDNFVRWFFK